MYGYTKLFESILTSTIWREDLATKVVWITMLALKNQDDVVEAAVPGLAHVAGVTLEECERALKKFQEPDRHSRTKEHEGRRIKEVPGGWLILNGEYYRQKLNEEELKELNRNRVQRFREREKQKKPGRKKKLAGDGKVTGNVAEFGARVAERDGEAG